MLSQPGRQLWFLLRLKIDTVVDTLDRLAVRPSRRFDLMCGVKLDHLIARLRIAESARRAHDLGAGEWTTSFLHRIPMRQNKVPRLLLAFGIAHHAADYAESVLRAHVGRDG